MPSPFGDPLCWLFPPPLSLLDELVGRVMRKNGTMSGPDFFFSFALRFLQELMNVQSFLLN